MQRLEVSGAVRPIYGSLGVKRLTNKMHFLSKCVNNSILLVFCMFRTSFVNHQEDYIVHAALYGIYIYTGLFKMIVGVLTTCRTQYT